MKNRHITVTAIISFHVIENSPYIGSWEMGVEWCGVAWSLSHKKYKHFSVPDVLYMLEGVTCKSWRWGHLFTWFRIQGARQWSVEHRQKMMVLCNDSFILLFFFLSNKDAVVNRSNKGLQYQLKLVVMKWNLNFK